jgi:hypothetical protein
LTRSADSIAGSIALVEHLISLGHRRIAMVSGPAGASTARDRIAGYSIALRKAGIPLDPGLVRCGEYRASSGEALTYQLLDEGYAPTAVFAANNSIAMGVLDALEKRGLSVPNDVALVCFDELPDASRFCPFLTVLAQPAYDMGMNAAQLLLSRLNAQVPLAPPGCPALPPGTALFLRPGDPDLDYDAFRGLHAEENALAGGLVKPLSASETAARLLRRLAVSLPEASAQQTFAYDKPDISRLLKIFHHQAPTGCRTWNSGSPAERTSTFRAFLEYDLIDTRVGGQSITLRIISSSLSGWGWTRWLQLFLAAITCSPGQRMGRNTWAVR